jgi:chemotaxis protein histidine kinase CheA
MDEIQTIKQEVLPVAERAAAMVVRNAGERSAAMAFLVTIKGAVKKVEEYWKPKKQAMDVAKRQLLDAEREMLVPLQSAEATLKASLIAFDREEAQRAEAERRRLQAIEDERARREQERLNQEAARQRAIEAEQRAKAEAARVAAEQASAADRARLQAEADAAERRANAAAAKVEAKEEASAYVAPVVVQVAAPVKQAGESTRTIWKARLVNLSALTGIQPGDVRLTFLEFDQSAANRFAAATKGAVTVPGIVFESEQSMAIRGSK